MILGGQTILDEIKNGNIVIDPFDENRINPNSYNLTLHEDLLIYETSISNPLDMKKCNKTIKTCIPEEGFLLKPGTLYLGRTVERTFTDKYVPMIEGRSSIGRLGLMIHVTAGFGDVGFDGTWTLEIVPVQPIIIYPNIEIAQIYYHTVTDNTIKYTSNKYLNQTDVTASRLYKDFEK